MATEEAVGVTEAADPQGLSDDALTKLTAAASIVNEALKHVLTLCVPGACVLELCEMGDGLMGLALSRIYTKKGKKLEKGLSYPTTVCVNEQVCHYSPSEKNEETTTRLTFGDVVKIEMGVHIDGFPVIAGHTILCSYTSAQLYSEKIQKENAHLFTLEDDGKTEESGKMRATTVKSGEKEDRSDGDDSKVDVDADIEDDEFHTHLLRRRQNETQQLLAQHRKNEDILQIQQFQLKQNLLQAGWILTELGTRLLFHDKSSSDLVFHIRNVSQELKVAPTSVYCSVTEMRKHVYEGTKIAHIDPGASLRANLPPVTFKAGEIYNLCIRVSTGTGSCQDAGVRPMIYRRAADEKYILKSTLGRQFMKHVEQNSPTFPFSLRSIDSRCGKVGALEASRHGLLLSSPLFVEKSGVLTATFSTTIVVFPSEPRRIGGLPFYLQEVFSNTIEVKDQAAQKVLAISIEKKKKKKTKKDQSATS